MVRLASRQHLPVMLYHALYASDAEAASIPEQDFRFGISVESFRRHLRMMCGFKTPPIEPWPDAPVITFDDTHLSHYRYAFPVLLEHDKAAYFLVLTERIGSHDSLSWKQLREMVSCGMSVGSHGITHTFLTRLGSRELRRELVDSKKRIEDELGKPVDALSVPGGRFSPAVLCAARDAGYRRVFTSEIRLNDPRGWVFGRYCSSELASDRHLEAYIYGRMHALYWPILQQAALRTLRNALGERGTETLLTPARKFLAFRPARVAVQTRDARR